MYLCLYERNSIDFGLSYYLNRVCISTCIYLLIYRYTRIYVKKDRLLLVFVCLIQFSKMRETSCFDLFVKVTYELHLLPVSVFPSVQEKVVAMWEYILLSPRSLLCGVTQAPFLCRDFLYTEESRIFNTIQIT